MQFELWCAQCAHNVWRKRAMAVLAARHAEFGRHGVKGGAAIPEAHRAERRCLDVFRDRVEHDVSSTVPGQSNMREEIIRASREYGELVTKPHDIKAIEHVQTLLLGYDPAQGGADPEAAADGHHDFEQEQEQEQEQEEEQEKEQEQQQQKEQEQEQEQEPEEPKREKYSRDDEHPRTWKLSQLGSLPSVDAQGFFPTKDFVVHRTYLSDNKKAPAPTPPARAPSTTACAAHTRTLRANTAPHHTIHPHSA